MARILSLAAVCGWLLLAGAHAVEHQCIHDKPHIQAAQAELLRTNPKVAARTVREAGRHAHQAAVDKIRITIDDTTLRTQGKYCASSSDTVPTFQKPNERFQCISSAILTDTKRDLLVNKILPRAVTRIQNALTVEQLDDALRVPSTSACGEIEIPQSHVSSGVANTDVVIYVSGAPIGASTVAFAAACASLSSTGRTVVGFMNFDPQHIPDESELETDGILDTAVHEIIHVLGLTGENLKKTLTTVEKRGKEVSFTTMPQVVSWVRKYTGCDTLEGGEIEDQGEEGSVGSHWERKVWYHELMTAVAGSSLSGLTLSFLAGLGQGYAATNGEGMTWGLNDGCGIHDQKCDTVEGGRNTYYCFESGDNCTFDTKAVGQCYIRSSSTSLPSYFQYFSSPLRGGPQFMDGCPIVVPYQNRLCYVPQNDTPTLDRAYGRSYGPTSRCYNTNPGLHADWWSSSVGPRCMPSKCDSQGTLTVEIPYNTSNFTVCPAGGSIEMDQSTGYEGTIRCPARTETMCMSLNGASVVPPSAGSGTISRGSDSAAEPTAPVATLSIAATLVAMLATL